jgi:hypothetical protein
MCCALGRPSRVAQKLQRCVAASAILNATRFNCRAFSPWNQCAAVAAVIPGRIRDILCSQLHDRRRHVGRHCGALRRHPPYASFSSWLMLLPAAVNVCGSMRPPALSIDTAAHALRQDELGAVGMRHVAAARFQRRFPRHARNARQWRQLLHVFTRRPRRQLNNGMDRKAALARRRDCHQRHERPRHRAVCRRCIKFSASRWYVDRLGVSFRHVKQRAGSCFSSPHSIASVLSHERCSVQSAIVSAGMLPTKRRHWLAERHRARFA